ncbi:hypothetical protein AAVH_24679 [Aphelenchoides avenae]|nr:hypothetical protein AAVH_24679 [Aphelenchus avenae]
MSDPTSDDVILAPELKAALKFLNAPLSDDDGKKPPPYILRECETSRPPYSSETANLRPLMKRAKDGYVMELDGVTPKLDPTTNQPIPDFEPYDPRGVPGGERHFDRVFRHLKTGELDAASRLVVEDAAFAKETRRAEAVDDVAVAGSSTDGKSAKATRKRPEPIPPDFSLDGLRVGPRGVYPEAPTVGPMPDEDDDAPNPLCLGKISLGELKDRLVAGDLHESMRNFYDVSKGIFPTGNDLA